MRAAEAGLEIRMEALSCRYRGTTVVHDVSLVVPAGQKVALTGTNGSGKTTLLRTVVGLHTEVTGRVAVGGQVARGSAGWARRRREVGWIPQRQAPGRFPLLARELLDSSGAGASAAGAAVDLGLADLLGRPLDTLSGGQLQRMYLARAAGCVAAGAGVLLADEPTAALDFAGQDEAADLLVGLPVTVLVVTHDRAVARRCDRVLEMAAGRIREVG
jgi:ABC-type Mn2+/Zn2+ transport system ATPase subunit